MGLILCLTSNAQNIIYSENFESGVINTDSIYGCGSLIQVENQEFNYVLNLKSRCEIKESYLELPQSIYSNWAANGTKELTFSIWIKMEEGYELKNHSNTVFCIYKDISSPLLELTTDLQLNANYDDESYTYDFSDEEDTFDSLCDGSWHYYAASLTTCEASVYIDGSLKKTVTLSSEFKSCLLKILTEAPSTNIATGLTVKEDPELWIDQIVIYDEALSESEIVSNYNSISRTTDINNTTTESDCEIKSTTYYDIKGNMVGDDYSALSNGVYIKKIEYTSGASECIKIVKTKY